MKRWESIIRHWSFLLGILFFFPVFVHAGVVINEVQIAGSTATDEFVELYNAGSESVDLAGWRLTKKTASGNEYNLLTSFPALTIQPGSFFVIGHEHSSVMKQIAYSTSQSLASDNTVILYRDAGETVVDIVGFGTASVREGNACQNQVEGNSLQRVPNGIDTNQNSADFVNAIPTPGVKNTVSAQSPSLPSSTQTPTNDSNQSSSGPAAQTISGQNIAADIVISEILPNPVGSDTDGEWIELKNNQMSSVDLVGWILEDASGHGFFISKSLANTDIAPNGFYTLDYAQTKITLNNYTDVIVLKRPDGVIADRISYSGLVEGQSYIRIERDWKVTDSPTKNASNLFTEAQKHESAKTQKQEGSTPLNPPLRRGEQKGGQETTSSEVTTNTQPPRVILAGKIRFSEIMPNPEGDDEDLEWIEVENVSDEPLKLVGLKLEDKTSESTLPEKTISAKGFVVYQKPEFSLTLNNSSETLRLFDALGDEIDSVSYEDSEEGVSFSRFGDAWKWTEPTKGTINKESKKHPDAQKVGAGEITKTQNSTSKKTSSSSSKSSYNITVSGTVLVRPNVFGKTIIYISGDDGNHQIYFQKGDWPDVNDGDVVNVQGQTSTAGDVPRIKIQSPGQITVTDHRGHEPEDHVIEDLSEDDIGGLFRITGEMLESSGSSLIIGDESGELEVYFKSSGPSRR